ncbi:MAG: gliding motility-associated ABC transporter ATP-binding subunit GldA [Reichenbachiella sp.]
MSIEVKNLVKIYGDQIAVNDISFVANKGEILGFLGPNGAGKSTTMKIATGYISANSGTVLVNGFDVSMDVLSAQKSIGYLPEHNPLYLDMYVHEFLHFSCKTYNVPKQDISERVKEVIALCGLTLEQSKLIGQLSKGYRQRVGLAQSLLHRPEVLILDEPTTGLDPNQIVEIRSLIRDVAKDRTVIFSSHIMQEVKALCDRVVVINKGKIVTDQTIEEFSKGVVDEIKLKVEFKNDIDLVVFDGVSQVTNIEKIGDGLYVMIAKDSQAARSEIFKLASEHNLPLVGLQEEQNSLEEVFHSLTKEK